MRIAILRLITTILYASDKDPETVSDVDILNLLPITQGGCQVIRTEKEREMGFASFEESLEATARTTSAFHKPAVLDPALANGTEEQVEQINDERITGPICHIRLYVTFARRGLFDKVLQWETSPEGLNVEGGLGRLKELASEAEVKHSLSIAIERVAERRETGNDIFRRKKRLDDARFEYWSAAELAAALVEFDDVSNGKYAELLAGMRKELVLNLGNAAEMSLGQGYFDRALVFTSAAVRLAERCAGKDDVGQSVIEKNKRRVTRAEDGIKRQKKG
ncbi:hypothetical protein FA13DRAFT_1805737 [Coprinellus micaceus]|uniref:Uncharacterized protein n=1 Tax=Coprinellus micaceus TaxID=71717 RepID=A0A4Y7RXM1_COPMI|nr:hypothetical protein FA13DRAFT_1805737 [Coprinellus micaceus]